jgi:tRNA-splicing ligase RtcB (3'-phosphate/5'-hydroxy nucleic acid ligase)
MVIPFNMEDGLLICEGKSNAEWNFSAPHGAGRLGSRAWAKKKFSASVVEKRMLDKGIYTSAVPVDEVKEAYKDPKIIENAIEPTAKIIDRVIPILNLKSKK